MYLHITLKTLVIYQAFFVGIIAVGWLILDHAPAFQQPLIPATRTAKVFAVVLIIVLFTFFVSGLIPLDALFSQQQPVLSWRTMGIAFIIAPNFYLIIQGLLRLGLGVLQEVRRGRSHVSATDEADAVDQTSSL